MVVICLRIGILTVPLVQRHVKNGFILLNRSKHTKKNIQGLFVSFVQERKGREKAANKGVRNKSEQNSSKQETVRKTGKQEKEERNPQKKECELNLNCKQVQKKSKINIKKEERKYQKNEGEVNQNTKQIIKSIKVRQARRGRRKATEKGMRNVFEQKRNTEKTR